MPDNHIGERLRLLRERNKLGQDRMAEILGLKERQSVSAIERGLRKVSADELVRVINHFEVTLDWLTNPFLLVGKGETFSWRQNGVASDILDAFEERAGEWIGAYRELNRQNGTSLQALLPRLGLSHTSSLDEAVSAGEAVGRELDLGDPPASRLADALAERLGVLVLMIDAPQGISGSACRLRQLNAILINRHERQGRRNTDLAHELFHILTWSEMRPARVESSLASWEAPRTNADKRNRDIERLADNFAAGLLMPGAVLDGLGPPRGDLVTWLISAADLLAVSSRTLKWRLVNSGRAPQLERVTDDDLRSAYRDRPNTHLPPLFSKPFIQTVGRAIEQGNLSIGRAARLLDLPKDELGGLFDRHGVGRPVEL
jgi:Zn-dependent peptidase ImmA (M78 family)/DNA-binding XRE family transcriptional regulator